jgi:predicted nucleic acid-binding protein
LKEAVVTDSTCLIALERLGRLDLLSSLFAPIYAPREVAIRCAEAGFFLE